MAFGSGTITGGLFTASLLAGLGMLAKPLFEPRTIRLLLAVAVGSAALLREGGLLRLRLPQNERQIPRDVLRKGPMIGSFQFGFELGTSARTFITSTAPYVLGLCLMMKPEMTSALAVGIGFGLGRASLLILRVTTRDREHFDSVLADSLLGIRMVGTGAVVVGLTYLALIPIY